MSRKKWYLNLGAVLYGLLSIGSAIQGNVYEAVLGVIVVLLIDIVDYRNREALLLRMALEVTRAELTNDNPFHEDALTKEELCGIVCEALKAPRDA